jgi:orotidine-5'-phosphate decarboxylase
MPPRLVVALDLPTLAGAERVVDALHDLDLTFKVGYESFYGYGAALIERFEARGASYMLDLKLHDIPRTVHAAVRSLVRPGVALMTVHAQGGREMLELAVEAAGERAAELGIPAPRVLAVTLLTSIGADDLPTLGLGGAVGENTLRLAGLARAARCAGVVCSVGDVAEIKRSLGMDFAVLCPGIRPAGSAHGDQKRVATPADASAAGVDYIVVGRPIVADADPREAARAVLDELGVSA